MEAHAFQRAPRDEATYCVKCGKPERAVDHWPFECGGRPVRMVGRWDRERGRICVATEGVDDRQIPMLVTDIFEVGQAFVFEDGTRAPVLQVRLARDAAEGEVVGWGLEPLWSVSRDG